MRLKKLSLLLALTLLVSVSALPVTAHAGGSKDTTPPTLTASLEGDALKIESSDDLSGLLAGDPAQRHLAPRDVLRGNAPGHALRGPHRP